MLRSDFITVGGELRQHHPCDLLSGPAGASPELRFWYALVPNNKSLGVVAVTPCMLHIIT